MKIGKLQFSTGGFFFYYYVNPYAGIMREEGRKRERERQRDVLHSLDHFIHATLAATT